MSTPAEKDRVPLIALIILLIALGLFFWFQLTPSPLYWCMAPSGSACTPVRQTFSQDNNPGGPCVSSRIHTRKGIIYVLCRTASP